jgi:hypothetical protein
MFSPSSTVRTMLKSGLASAITLVGGVILGGLVGFIAFESLPGHMMEAARIGFSVLPALSGMVIGGALWGGWMARIIGIDETKRMAWAGGLGYGGSVILAGVVLSGLEVVLVENSADPIMPLHRVFTLLFVPAIFFVAGMGAFSLGIGLKNPHLGGWMGIRAGLGSALTFLLVNQVMEAMGWIVGAPGAAERSTMITVLMVGNLAAAIVGGLIIGAALGKYRKTGS